MELLKIPVTSLQEVIETVVQTNHSQERYPNHSTCC